MELNSDDSACYNNRGWAYRELGHTTMRSDCTAAIDRADVSELPESG
jgi:hypothetical protein